MKYITTAEELAGVVAELEDDSPLLVGVDTETTGLSARSDSLRLIQLSWDSGEKRKSIVIDCFRVDPTPLKSFFSSPQVAKVFYNAKFDIQFLMSAAMEVDNAEDAMLAFYVFTNGEPIDHSLVSAVNQVLSLGWVKENKKKMQQSEWTAAKLTEEQLKYAARDAEILLDLFPRMIQILRARDLYHVYSQLELPAMYAVAEMEFNGVPVNQEIFTNLAAVLDPEIENLQHEIKETFRAAGHEIDNIGSTQQLCKALSFIGVETKTSAEDALKEFDHPVIEKIIRFKNSIKMRQFVTKLPTHINPVTNRIHCSFNQTGTKSGRFSSSKPNLQQIPRSGVLRSFIHASEDTEIVVCDYSQIELVIAAEIAGEEKMIAAYQQGLDIHKLTASMVLDKPLEEVTKNDRQLAKSVNFGLLYGMGYAKLVDYAKNSYGVIITPEQAKEYRDKFFASYPGLVAWHEKSKQEIRSQMTNRRIFCYTLSGRRRIFSPDSRELNGIRFTSYVNTQDQGTGGDITKLALAKLRKALKGTGINPILQVHDEIVLEAPKGKSAEAREILERCMIQAGEQLIKHVPVKVEGSTGRNWAEAK